MIEADRLAKKGAKCGSSVNEMLIQEIFLSIAKYSLKRNRKLPVINCVLLVEQDIHMQPKIPKHSLEK